MRVIIYFDWFQLLEERDRESVCIFVFICIYVCMYVCVCVCVCVCMCACMCVYVYVMMCAIVGVMYMYVCVCVSLCECVCMCVYACLSLCVWVYVSTYVCVYLRLFTSNVRCWDSNLGKCVEILKIDTSSLQRRSGVTIQNNRWF